MLSVPFLWKTTMVSGSLATCKIQDYELMPYFKVALVKHHTYFYAMKIWHRVYWFCRIHVKHWSWLRVYVLHSFKLLWSKFLWFKLVYMIHHHLVILELPSPVLTCYKEIFMTKFLWFLWNSQNYLTTKILSHMHGM